MESKKNAYIVKFEFQKRIIATEEQLNDEKFIQESLSYEDVKEIYASPNTYVAEIVPDKELPYGHLAADFKDVEEVRVIKGRLKGLTGRISDLYLEENLDRPIVVELMDEDIHIVAEFGPNELEILQ